MSTFRKAEDFLAQDYCYGEVYHYEGEYWAEVIVVNDGYDQVSMKSSPMASREDARKWLAKQGVKARLTISERIETALNMGLLPGFASIASQIIASLRRNLTAA